MAEQAERKTTGAAWAAAKGERQVGVTLTPDEHRLLRGLAGDFDLSKAEFSRRLIRWAIDKSKSEQGLRQIKKMVREADKSLDSGESGE